MSDTQEAITDANKMGLFFSLAIVTAVVVVLVITQPWHDDSSQAGPLIREAIQPIGVTNSLP